MGSALSWISAVSQPLKTEDTARAHYRRHLLNKLLTLFVWDGFDSSIPTQYIEGNLLLDGCCGFLLRDGVLTPVPVWGAEAPDEFYRAKTFTYAQPVLGSGTIDSDSVIYNDSLAPWFPVDCKETIDKYADMLAAADISLKIAIKNSRLTYFFVTDNEQDVKTVNDILDGVSKGAMATAAFSKTLIGDGVKILPAVSHGVDFMRQLSETTEYIYNRFLSEFGVHANTVLKRERQLTDEIDMQIERPAFNVWGMLQSRVEGAARINAKYGTNITVKLNPAITIVEDTHYDDVYDDTDIKNDEADDLAADQNNDTTEQPDNADSQTDGSDDPETADTAEQPDTDDTNTAEQTDDTGDINISININTGDGDLNNDDISDKINTDD